MLLSYDHLTGLLMWKKRDVSLLLEGGHSAAHTCNRWNSKFAGEGSFTATKGDGYKTRINLWKKLPRSPCCLEVMTQMILVRIDHIDGDRTNNKWSNLRSVTRTENSRNIARHKDNTSGTTGVRYVAKGGLWQSYIIRGRTFISLGSYKNKDDAVCARKKGEEKYGFHANHGRNNPNPAA